jgi:hypothetical protein
MTNYSAGYPAMGMSGFCPQPYTNAIFVTSLEEAIMRTTERNSDIIYFNQSGEYFYRVKVDTDGKKSWASYKYTLPDQDTSTPATRADIQAFDARLKALEERLASKEVSSDEKSS